LKLEVAERGAAGDANMMLRRFIAFCVCWVCWCVAITASAESRVKASSKAKEHFAAGLAHVDDPAGPQYEEAYREFKAAYAETPSYEIAVNVGYCAFFLERDEEAIAMYELFLSKATERDIPPKKRAQMLKDVQALRAGLVRVSVKTVPARANIVDERYGARGNLVVNRYSVENGEVRLGIHPGHHKLTLTAEGYAAKSWEFEAEPASEHRHEFVLATDAAAVTNGAGVRDTTARPLGASSAAPDAHDAHDAHDASAPGTPGANANGPDAAVTATSQPKRLSTGFYVGAAATGAFTLGAIASGLVAVSKKHHFESMNDGSQPDEAQSAKDTMRNWALVSDVCTGAAVVSAAATLYFYLQERPLRPAQLQQGVVSRRSRNGAVSSATSRGEGRSVASDSAREDGALRTSRDALRDAGVARGTARDLGWHWTANATPQELGVGLWRNF
jgi:hypothetical protein